MAEFKETPNRKKVENLLWKLIDGCKNANDVAERLLQMGCKGTRGHECGCPLWVYLQKNGIDARVMPISVNLKEDKYMVIHSIILQSILQSFIRNFDNISGSNDLQVYKDLIL